MEKPKIILFTEHFNVRHVVDRLHLEKTTLERTLNSDADSIIVEGSVIYRRENGVYQQEKKENLAAIKTSHIVMAYGPEEIIGYPPKQQIYITVKYRLTGLDGGLIGQVPIASGHPLDNELALLRYVSRRFADDKFVFLMNPAQGEGKDHFHKLFGNSLENPAILPYVLLNRTEDSVFAQSIVMPEKDKV